MVAIGLKIEDNGRYNTKIKRYRDGSYTVAYCDKQCYVNPDDRFTGFETDETIVKLQIEAALYVETEENRKIKDEVKEKLKKRKLNDERSDNMKRAIDKIYDIALQNDWSYFMTITINPEEFDSKEPKEVYKKLSVWLRNQSQRKGLKYLLIPEYHKNGGIHAHALINDCFSLVHSGRYLLYGKSYKAESIIQMGLSTDNLKPVYNVPEWKYGFSTAIPVDGTPARLASYITKYITKDFKKIFGKYYLSSRNLVRDTEVRLCNSDKFEQLENVQYSHCGMSFKYTSDFRMSSEDDREVPEDIISYLAKRGAL